MRVFPCILPILLLFLLNAVQAIREGTVYIMLPYLIYVCFRTFLFIKQVPICVQFTHTIGKNIQSKSVPCYDGSVFLYIDAGHVYGQNKMNPNRSQRKPLVCHFNSTFYAFFSA
jgi:hypothetical protein